MSALPVDTARVQARTLRALVAGQVLGGLGIGATLSIGAILAAHVSGSDEFAGAAATLSTLGAAAAAIPLARLTGRLGRRVSLTTGTLTATLGAIVVIVATGLGAFPLLLLGFALLGVGSAVNLQSRFAATDLASPSTRGRQLSIVVWSTTIGSVVGPNLSGPGEQIALTLGLPELTGSFVIAIVAQLLAAAIFLVALRPDPYLLSREIAQYAADAAAASASAAETTAAGSIRSRRLVILAIGSIAATHAVMVAVMAMTPLHLTHHGSSIAAVGFTISLHIAGMYALSPVFGWLSDRVGRFPTVLAGQGLLAVGLAIVSFGESDAALVTAGLTFIGLGWSATTVSGSALVSDLARGDARPKIQGRSDLSMNIAGAIGGAGAGPLLALVGYAGLAGIAGILVVAVVIAVLLVPRSAQVRLSDRAN